MEVVVNFMSWPLKEPSVPIDRRLGGPQSRSGRYAEKNFLPPPGIEHRRLWIGLFWLRIGSVVALVKTVVNFLYNKRRGNFCVAEGLLHS
jgi:hypothetical protein